MFSLKTSQIYPHTQSLLWLKIMIIDIGTSVASDIV